MHGLQAAAGEASASASASSSWALPAARGIGVGSLSFLPPPSSLHRHHHPLLARAERPRVRPRQGPRQAPTCSLTVLRSRTLRRLLPAQFTGDQWKYYWGITESDKFGKIYEAASATFFGLWTSWFLTFLIGLPASTILGTVFLFYWILAPGLAAYRRNVSFRGTYFARHPRDDGVFGALFSGRVVRVGRITQSREYNRPEALVMCVEDEEGRKLRVYAPLQPSYKRVRPGMRCEGLVLSETPGFEELLGVSDMFVPACGAWVGDYPYLDKVQFKEYLAGKLRREREKRKGSLLRMKAGLLGSGGGGRGQEEDEDAMPVEFLLEKEDGEGREGELLPVYDRADEEVYGSMWENDDGGHRGGRRRGAAFAAGAWDDEEDDEAMFERIQREQEERMRRRREQQRRR